MADSQRVYTEMVAERKTEEIIPYGSKNSGIQDSHFYTLIFGLMRADGR